MSKIAITIISVIVILYNSPTILAQTNPAALKKCPDGTSILASQSCDTTVPIAPPVIQSLADEQKSTLSSEKAAKPKSSSNNPYKFWGPAPLAADAPTPVGKQAIKKLKKDRKKLRRSSQGLINSCFKAKILTNWEAERKLTSCDTLLAQAPDPYYPINQRAILLQQRAVALINLNDLPLASDAIEESSQLLNQNADQASLYSIMIGNKMLESYIAHMLGDNDEAIQILSELRTIRPYAKSITVAIDKLEDSYIRNYAHSLQQKSARSKFDPNIQRQLVPLYIVNNDIESASQASKQVSILDPKQLRGWTSYNDENELQQFISQTSYNASVTFIESITSNKGYSADMFNHLKEDIQLFVGVHPKLAIKNEEVRKKTKIHRSTIKKYERRKLAGEIATNIVEQWQNITEMRHTMPFDNFNSVLKVLDNGKYKQRTFPGIIELVNEYGRTDNKDSQLAVDFRKTVIKDIEKDSIINPSEIAIILPRSEFLESLPKLKSDGPTLLFDKSQGYSQKREKNNSADIRTVRFVNQIAPATAEELLLLAIADYGSKNNKDRFILLSNETRKRTLIYNSVPQDAGYIAQARVKFLTADEAALETTENQKRIITASELRSNLMPRYKQYDRLRREAKAAKKDAKKKK